MRRWELLGTVLMAVWIAGAAQAMEPEGIEDPPICLAVELTDGSRVIGVPAIAVIPLHTLLGKVETPLRHIVDIVFDRDHERSTVTMVNGDRISGAHGLEKLGLTTLFGEVSIDAVLIRTITLQAPDRSKEK